MKNFNKPKAVIWKKVNGDVTAGMLTSNMSFVPEELQPKSAHPKIRGYRRLFCLNRHRWVSLYTKNILEIV